VAHLARSTEPARGDDPDNYSGRRVHRHRLSKRSKGSFWREVPILVLTALVLTFLIQTFLARVYVIPSASMESTLHGCPGCTNDRVLVDKLTPGELWKEIIERQNTAVALLAGAVAIGISSIIAAAVHG